MSKFSYNNKIFTKYGTLKLRNKPEKSQTKISGHTGIWLLLFQIWKSSTLTDVESLLWGQNGESISLWAQLSLLYGSESKQTSQAF